MLKILVTALVFTAAALAQIPDFFQVGYAANMNIGDSVVNLTNAGSVGGFEPTGNICANVYVFAEDQQLIACCACPLTPNHLKTLSVRNDLISNTLTPGVPIGVTIALLANQPAASTAAPGPACNPAAVAGEDVVAGMRAWSSTIHALPDGTYGVTETAFLPALLSETEFRKLTTYCGFIQANGSGYGNCKSCREGAAGAARQ